MTDYYDEGLVCGPEVAAAAEVEAVEADPAAAGAEADSLVHLGDQTLAKGTRHVSQECGVGRYSAVDEYLGYGLDDEELEAVRPVGRVTVTPVAAVVASVEGFEVHGS